MPVQTAYLDTQNTSLGQQVARFDQATGGKSGFFLLTDGVDALAARLLLAVEAERSLDVQYYFILDDLTGRLFVQQLLVAADRGVRVRLLLDDIHTGGLDVGLSALQAHPKVDVRVFNPFANRTGRWRDFAGDFDRVNKRMHNKSFTADNQVTIVGGRNIGDEYFDASDELMFADLDVIGAGTVAQDVSRAFDDYWNSSMVMPISVLVEAPSDPAQVARLRHTLKQSLEASKTTPYADVLHSTILNAFSNTEDQLIWAPYRVVVDAPDKSPGTELDNANSTVSGLRDMLVHAQNEVLIVSPYFVPRESGVKLLGDLVDRGVSVNVVTNSLSATDVSAVHAGYSKYRRKLLERGVSLYEVVNNADTKKRRSRGIQFSRTSLHAKVFNIDRRHLFVGSFNWDPRSIELNTEMGVIIDSPELARESWQNLESVLAEVAYKLNLDSKGSLVWQGQLDGETVTYTREPNTSWWRRFSVWFVGLFPIEDQL